MKHVYIALTLVLLCGTGAFGQKRSVTVNDGRNIYTYAITRYVPVWEIQSGKEKKEGLLSQHQQFFKEATSDGLRTLKELMYSKAMVPDAVQKMDARATESFLSSNRLVIHYRVQYKNHSIFLAHLNNSPVRSVIPFRVEGGKWILDPSFANTELYGLLSSRDFDPYMGVRKGEVVCSYGFEDVVDMTRFYDYSGNANNMSITSSATMIEGRFGDALKLSGNAVGTAVLKNASSSNGTSSIDMHLQIAKMVYNTEKVRGIWSFEGNDEHAMKLEVAGSKLRLSYTSAAGMQRVEWKYSPDTWAHIDVEMTAVGISVEVDGMRVASSTIPSNLTLTNSKFQLGAPNGVKANMDEFRITN